MKKHIANKGACLLFLLLDVTHFACLAQFSNNDELQILRTIFEYKDCNEICINTNIVELDTEVVKMILSVKGSTRKFRKGLNKLKPNMPKLSKYTNTILKYKSNADWNKLVKNFSITNYSINCDYKFSIMKPILISNSEALVIVANYKYDIVASNFDAFVYYYFVNKIGVAWIVTSTVFVYDISYDWKNN